MSAREMSLTTIASSPLAASLLARELERLRAVLGGEADDRLARRGAAARSAGEHVGGGLERELEALAARLLDLALGRVARARSRRRRRPSAARRRRGTRCSHAACSSAAVPTSSRSTPVGRRAARRWRRAASPAAPRSRRGSASAKPMRPEELLPTKRTLSIGSRVPPAVTSTLHAAREARRGGARRRPRSAAASDPLGLGQAPDPAPRPCEASRPRSGLDDGDAALAQQSQVRLRRRVLVHPVVHRGRDHQRAAGGERAAGEHVVGLARPRACAIVLADAGAITIEVGVVDEREVAERVVRRAAPGRERRRGRGRARTRSTQHRRAGQRREGGLADEPPAGRASARRGREWPAPVASARTQAPCRRRCRR